MRPLLCYWKLPQAVRTTQIWPFPFRMSPMGDIEGDLKEAQKKYRFFCGRKAARTFLTGATLFVLEYNRLVEIAELVHRYFLEMETIGSFVRVTDITLKTDEELAALHEAGQGGYLVTVFFYLTGISGTGRFQCLLASRCFTGR